MKFVVCNHVSIETCFWGQIIKFYPLPFQIKPTKLSQLLSHLWWIKPLKHKTPFIAPEGDSKWVESNVLVQQTWIVNNDFSHFSFSSFAGCSFSFSFFYFFAFINLNNKNSFSWKQKKGERKIISFHSFTFCLGNFCFSFNFIFLVVAVVAFFYILSLLLWMCFGYDILMISFDTSSTLFCLKKTREKGFCATVHLKQRWVFNRPTIKEFHVTLGSVEASKLMKENVTLSCEWFWIKGWLFVGLEITFNILKRFKKRINYV